jgi:predicted TIM-barrel enzyme
LECQYVPAKGDYRYHMVNSWSCSNESKPWQQYPGSEPRACTASTTGDKYWERDEGQTITVTYPPATISATLQNCTLNNGWCSTTPHLSLIGSEPVSDYSILAIEGTRNGQAFACSGSTCNVPLIEGNNSFNFWAFSSFADTSLMGTLSAKVDSHQPAINGTLTGTAGLNNWYTGPVTLNSSATDATSGVASFNCTLDGAPLPSCSSITVNGDGLHTITLTARDQAGNTRVLTQNASIDSQSPSLDASISGSRSSNNWYTAATLSGSASDPSPGSGLSAFEYNLDDGDWTAFPSSGILTLPEGSHTINLRGIDLAGHTVTSSRSFRLDRSVPVLTVSPSGTLGNDRWYVTPPSISATALDEISGIKVLEYAIDTTSWTDYSAPIVLDDGVHTVSFWAEDQAGHVTQADETYKVDSRPPLIAGNISGVPGQNGWFVSDVILSASAADPIPGSGMDAFTYTLNDNPEISYSDALSLSDGQHTLQFQARDRAGLPYFLEESIKVDTIHPLLIVNTPLPAWIKDRVTLSGTASDDGSGLMSVDISIDGGQAWQSLENPGSWNYSWSTLDASNGPQEILLRAIDYAGLVFQQSLKTGVDNQPPQVTLPADWLQWDTVTLDVHDEHSGLASAQLEISDPESRWPSRIIQLDVSQFPLQFTWDRRFGDGTTAPAGTYDLKLTAQDHLGHSTIESASIKVILTILPPGPTSTPLPPTPRLASTSTPTYLPTSSPTINPTRTTVVWIFGSTLEPDLSITPTPGTSPTQRPTPTQDHVDDWFEYVFGSAAGTSESTTEIGSLGDTDSNSAAQESGVLWGAAAAAMMGAMTSYALDEKRKREEEQARLALLEAEADERRDKSRARKMEKIEKQRALERLWEQARLDEEQDAKQRKQEKLLLDLNRMNERILLRGPDSEEPARWKAVKDAIRERYEKKLKDQEAQRKAEELQEGLAAYYNARKQGEATDTVSPKEKSWFEKGLKWIDDHQTEIALGIGVAVGVGAIILSGGAATPLVAAAWIAGSAAVAGGTVALGTMGLNAYFNRPLGTNILRNFAVAAGAAAATTGVGLALAGGLVQQGVYRVGNGITSTCIQRPAFCARVSAGIELWDKVEDIGLQAKLAIQTACKDPRAGDTALELQMERLDQVPGNATFREIYETAVDLLGKHTDEIAQITQIAGRLGDDVKIYADGIIKFGNNATPEDIAQVLKDLRALPNRYAWASGSTIYVNAPTQKAIETVNRLKAAVASGADDDTIDQLIYELAAAATRGNGKRVVLGAWNSVGGYIGDAVEKGDTFFDTGKEVWDLLESSGIKPWRVNEAFMRMADKKGLTFELTAKNMDNWEGNVDAIKFLKKGDIKAALDSVDRTPEDGLTYRLLEAQWLLENGYTFKEYVDKLVWSKP